MLQSQHDHHDSQSHQQVFYRAVVGSRGAAAKRTDAHADQGQTDGQHYRAGDHGGEETAQGFEESTQNRLKQAAQNRSAHDGCIGNDAAAHDLDHALEHADEAGAGAHDDGDFAAYRADGKQLYQGDDASHQHGVLQQSHLNLRKLFGAAAGRTQAGDDQDGGQVTYEHGQHMLQA